MLKRQNLLIVLLFICSYGFSQEKENKKTAKRKHPDSHRDSLHRSVKKSRPLPENIESFPKDFLIRPRFVYPLLSVNITNRVFGKAEKIVYLPAMPGVVGLALKIKKVYISAAVQLPSGESLKKKYGSTQFRNINIHFRARFVSWGIFYRDYRGFYLSNYKKFYPDWNVDSAGYPRTSKLRIVESGIHIDFNFNKNFSLIAAFTQGERQKKSAGSFLMDLTGRFQRVDPDSAFIPLSQVRYYPQLDKLKYGNFISVVPSLGFGYQIVYHKFHITPVLMAGAGLQLQNYRSNRTYLRFNLPTYASAKTQLGYNGDHFFTNLVLTYEFNSIPVKESRVRLFYYAVEYGIGVRF